MIQLLKSISLICLIIFFLSGCKKDDPIEINDGEVITTLQLVLVPIGGGTALTYEYKDIDGPGGLDPTSDLIILNASSAYNVSIRLLNESQNPAGDLTPQVEAESASHRFYFEPSGGSNISVTNLNNDVDGVPLGLQSTWNTGIATDGTVRIVLRHYAGNPPGKEANDPVNSHKSSTDILVDFETRIN